MGVKFTEEQQQVIDLRNRNILVSAAAGSGKTAVLVERIITRLTKDDRPLNVDELLIVTYTEAAAAEMKERIHHAIEKALEEEPDNVHLQRQSTLIHQAQITTIHKFCLSVIRDHFHTIDLDPSFRVGEEGELKLLKHDVADAVLEAAYESEDSAFLDFVESFAFGKDDRKLEELIFQLYEFSRSYPNPKRWLDSCYNQYHIKSVDELEQSTFVQDIMEDMQLCFGDMQRLLEFGISICEDEDGPAVYKDALHSDWKFLKELQVASSFTKLQDLLTQVKWAKLSACRDKTVDENKIQQVKNVREEVKELVKSVTKQYFYDDVSELQKELLKSEKNMKTLTELVKVFADSFLEEKRQKNLIDFNDMEQYALQILTCEKDGVLVPSAVAETYQAKYAEVMIDEYQDSNLVQEAILTSVSGVSKGVYNIFMVGDVKQSIYRFRLSRPELFMEKFHTYSLEDSNKQRVDLYKNFRSRREVLESTNFIFEQIMIPEFGGIAYDEKAALYVGADYEKRDGNETELLLVEGINCKTEERMEMEAESVAKRIKEFMQGYKVYDRQTETYRSLKYSDIVILTRSLKNWTDVFRTIFNQEGIPTYTSSKEGYFETQEIRLILAYLRILDNPRQDIPFAAVLTSVFGNFSSEELAIIKNYGSGKSLYDVVKTYAENGEQDEIRKKLIRFLNTYEQIRFRVPYTAIHTLLWQIMEETGYGDYMSAMPGGEQRTANLEMLVEKAIAFEGTSYKGLFNFVRYIEQLQKYEVDYGEVNLTDENMDAVCLMSIHKSKGLEFPIVFVVGMGKQFNTQDTRQSIVVHPELGVGIDSIDPELRVKSPTLLKKVIQQKVMRESKEEELRVLYVAMTRAKEKLILSGSTVDLEKDLQRYAFIMEQEAKELPYYTLTKANKYLDWVIPALIRNQCITELLGRYRISAPFQNPLYFAQIPISVKRITEDDLIYAEIAEEIEEQFTREVLEQWDTSEVYDEQIKSQIEEQFSYRYPYQEEAIVKQKLSVSELKKKAYMEEDGQSFFGEEEVIPLLPKFLQEEKELTGASKGSAYHKVLEILDFKKSYDLESLELAIKEKFHQGLLSKEMLMCIRAEDILVFLQSPVGQRMQQAALAGKCFAEQPFVLGIEAKELYIDMDSDENLLIQGIIDVYFEEEDGLVVLDYKTDKVKSAKELIDRYQAQLVYYAQALERLTGKSVKEKIIYSFALEKEIEV